MWNSGRLVEHQGDDVAPLHAELAQAERDTVDLLAVLGPR